jgi:hypothetical protein
MTGNRGVSRYRSISAALILSTGAYQLGRVGSGLPLTGGRGIG